MRYKLSIPVTISLIALTILLITAFQVYWLNKNYREEEKLFSTRTNILFRETLFHLQASKLKLDSGLSITVQDRQGVTRITNVLQERLRDSAGAARPAKRAVFLTVKGSPAFHDSLNTIYSDTNKVHRVRVVDFLAGVDSLRDSLTVKEITSLYSETLRREKINTPFTIHTVPVDTPRDEIMPFPNDFDGNIVTIGFTKPVSYQLAFSNNTWYLLQRISQPILISTLLLSITILSFLLLYRNLKQQRKLAQLKNDFISNITHELKTPIATVSVAIEALRSFDVLEDRATTNEYLEISANEMQRLSLLVDKVLKLSMFENREITLSKEQFDLRALAASVMESMRLQFEKHRAHTSIKTSGHNFIITADKLHITSVLYNLLDNALKYSIKDPEILIHILDHGQYLEIRVTDNGMGIAKEYKGKIFEKFFRIPNGNRHNIKGYGLGLSYVSHIVQRHMGFIEVESELHKGSTFSVKLPFVEAPVIYYDKNRQIRSKIF
ncbi:cell wall metabolism sensor histidine kinase WalK [Chitinophaga sp. CF418]|uniref:sensor histidine kinase n=1 Tax=Chitinophaga sp. CF418 TaxID=1855287 RepID=UPI000914E580|nr:HAMP domain-containing sensor histidine kinase [Chitinophaga sp. CF418]SHN32224.1 two-component system, OmpR family, phosphate regulon sensor histidine kinase PhoR [Chitinophaga sp. CF418]